jgi:hypothetical protein
MIFNGPRSPAVCRTCGAIMPSDRIPARGIERKYRRPPAAAGGRGIGAIARFFCPVGKKTRPDYETESTGLTLTGNGALIQIPVVTAVQVYQ